MKPTDEQRYESYRTWCQKIGVRAAEFSVWLHRNGSVGEWWYQLGRDQMGGRFTGNRAGGGCG